MQALTGRPSTMTRHWEHWPLAQKIPWGLPSFAWWPKMCTPPAIRAEEIISAAMPVIGRPFQVKSARRPSVVFRMGWLRMRIVGSCQSPGGCRRLRFFM